MHPATSIILFTTLSGAGLGLGFWFGIVSGSSSPAGIVITAGLALVLTGIGLLCSVFHLRRPSRAWRAFSQWRSSWLSREGILAPVACLLLLLHAAALWTASPSAIWTGPATAMICIVVVITTSMIYAQIKAVPAWNTPLTPIMFLCFAAAGGALLACAIPGMQAHNQLWFVSAAIALNIAAWGIKLVWWQRLDSTGTGPSSPETATGLGGLGRVRLLESPHTGSNYLLDEMGYVVARRHARKLRRISLILGGVAVPIALAIGLAFELVPYFAAIAVLLHLVAAGLSRWLFFAEARHVVTLYY